MEYTEVKGSQRKHFPWLQGALNKAACMALKIKEELKIKKPL